ncbi:hypothetical protein ACI79G_14920 [Geodermatophilus sp. SYSU D00779]
MADQYVDAGVPFLRSQNVRPFRLNLTDVKYIPQSFHQRLRKSTLRPGDVVVVRTGTPGAAAVVPPSMPECNCADLVVIRPGPALDSRYLAYFINGAAGGYVASRLVGAVQQHFNIGAARELEVPLLSIEQQRAIAQTLGVLDDKIEHNDAVRSRLRELGFAELARAQDGAQPIALGSLVASVSRGTAPAYSDEPNSVPVLNQKCVRGGWVDESSARFAESRQVRREKKVERGDVLINSGGVGTLGRAARWLAEEPIRADGLLSIVKPDVAQVHPAVLGYLLIGAQSRIEQLAEGSTGQTHLPKEQLLRLELSVPAQQWALGEALEAFDSLAETLRSENRVLAAVRDALLWPLLSGQLRVRDAEALAGEAV